MAGPVELWYCGPGAVPRKCRNVPCHGHRATRDQLLTARVIAHLEGIDYWRLYRPELRSLLRRAWGVLQDIRAGKTPEESA